MHRARRRRPRRMVWLMQQMLGESCLIERREGKRVIRTRHDLLRRRPRWRYLSDRVADDFDTYRRVTRAVVCEYGTTLERDDRATAQNLAHLDPRAAIAIGENVAHANGVS